VDREVAAGQRAESTDSNDFQDYSFARLERAIGTLMEQYLQLQAENDKLCQELQDRERRVHALDEALLEANQRRQDVLKRVDDLVAQLDQLDAGLESQDG